MSQRTVVVVALAVMATALFAPASARAASGYVEGYIRHYQNQGNFCPTGRDCWAAQYVQAEFNTYVPARNAYVYLRDQNDNVIGTGTTDSAGYYKFFWYSPSMPTGGSVIWTLKHATDRFQVRSPTGATFILWSSIPSIINGTTHGSPQNLGTRQWGSAGSPHQLTNAYDGAEKMWSKALAHSNRMVNGFSNLDIRAFSNSTPYVNCSSSCARGPENRIQLDVNAAFAPQARVMHEMGHIASYVSDTHTFGGDYCYPSTGGGACAWWALNTPEWRYVTFEEGIATFFGDTAIYWAHNSQPHTCWASAAACPLNVIDVEASTGSGACVTNEGRQPISAVRYLRDMYDAVNDPNYGDAMARPFYEFFDVLAQFPNGTSDHQKDEPWNSSYSMLDNRDGRRACDDFSFHFTALTGLVTTNQCSHNCSP